MARASIQTIIPLDRVPYVVGTDPLHFNSVETDNRPSRYACDDMWFQYDWQDAGRVSREALAMALRSAEDIVFQNLGYYLIPLWIEEEEKILVKPYAIELRNIAGRNSRGDAKSVRTEWAFVVEGGVRAKSVIEAGAAVAYSDNDGDSYDETATVSVATALTDEEEIHVYFPGESGDDAWEIRPITVAISGGTAVITFRREQAVDPDLWEKQPGVADQIVAVDGDDDAKFLTTVDVYRVYNDPSDQATFVTEGTCNCGESSCAACATTEETGCLTVRDSKRGIVAYRRATWNVTTESYDVGEFANQREPDKILINYRAGLLNHRNPLPYTRVDPLWERHIVFYALSLLIDQPQGCDNFKAVYNRETEDLSLRSRERAYSVPFEDLGNPLGTSRAALRLWKLIKHNRRVAAR